VAKINALASAGKPEPVRVVGHLHVDNAGEFLSHEFNEYLDSESITRTTCPPHVHQLNGVAERSIRSLMEIACEPHARRASAQSASGHTSSSMPSTCSIVPLALFGATVRTLTSATPRPR
jgi:hypothetical protein